MDENSNDDPKLFLTGKHSGGETRLSEYRTTTITFKLKDERKM